MTDLVVDVQVDRAAVGEQRVQQLEALAEKGEKRLARECIGIGDLSPASAADGVGPAGADAEDRVRRERRVDVDEVDAPCEAVLGDEIFQGNDIVAVDEQALGTALGLGFIIASLLRSRLDSGDWVHGIGVTVDKGTRAAPSRS